MSQIGREKPKVHNTQPVGPANIRILTKLCPKISLDAIILLLG